MTSPAEPASGDATQASQVTKPLRELAALVLLGANAVLLFVGLLRLLVPTNDYSTITGRAGTTFFIFIGVESAVLPLLAVLLATHVRPVLARAKLITQAALGEYAFAALFGALTFLISLVGRLADGDVLEAFRDMLAQVAYLAIFGIAAFVVFRIWRTLYFVPKPKPQPGLYGQPQPGWPQQPGGYPVPGQGGYVPGGHPGQPGGYPVPGQYGPPQSAPPFNPAPPHAPQSGPPFGAPQSAPPFGAPQPGPPFGGPHPAPPFGQPPSADPTQAIPRQPADPAQPSDPDSDRTQRFDRDDPNHPR
ncbi:hypothetical protein Q2K19_06280 [Micromonospora soli]|uniref:hypothetical protein n=1 Tax=Micromonospora sp. NBRC 110009 TaxID=3061627 RepID=UPI0026711AD5|nr:hypothetical protein [Micromonospora sp. NBRC 110009]WKU00094.1 hypothetical protein Q2K19_06280 [Micromonospora sp. NBRC 110009]